MNCIFSICSPNFIPYARNVSSSFLEHNPGYTYHLFITDKVESIEYDFGDSRINFHFCDNLDISELPEMKLRYPVFEYANSLKPFLAKWLLEKFPIKNLLYTDTDMMYFGRVSAVEKIFENNDIILTPHLSHPIDFNHDHYQETDFLNAGLYNAGFIGMHNSTNSHAFLDWWKQRMFKLCKIDFAKGLFVDQIWLNLVPLYFQKVHILNDPSYNMAPWNLTERTFNPNNHLVNDNYPLISYHFSGYEVGIPNEISAHQTRYTFDNRKELLPLYEKYVNQLMQFGLIPEQPQKFHFNDLGGLINLNCLRPKAILKKFFFK
jgi:hypothetical protein